MPTECWSSVNGEVMRLTRLDDCCTPPAAGAPCAMIVTDGFVSVQYSPEIAEADDIELKNAKGVVCVSKPGCDELKWFNLQMNFCNIDPDVFAFITGSPLVLDWEGNSVGNRVEAGTACDINFALEIWTEIPSDDCAAGAKRYGYFLVPCISGGVLGDFTVENDALTLQFNSKSKGGAGWGTGPYNVDAIDADNTAGPLATPIGTKQHLDMHVTTIAPPEPSCGCAALPAAPVVPPEAAGATAGTPGTFTPAGSQRPSDFAELVSDAVVATPATAWTVGQYVVLGDGSHAYWDAAAWQVGEAPAP